MTENENFQSIQFVSPLLDIKVSKPPTLSDYLRATVEAGKAYYACPKRPRRRKHEMKRQLDQSWGMMLAHCHVVLEHPEWIATDV